MTTPAVVKFDGSAQPNRGPAAIGYIVETDDAAEWVTTASGTQSISKSSTTPSSKVGGRL